MLIFKYKRNIEWSIHTLSNLLVCHSSSLKRRLIDGLRSLNLSAQVTSLVLFAASDKGESFKCLKFLSDALPYRMKVVHLVINLTLTNTKSGVFFRILLASCKASLLWPSSMASANWDCDPIDLVKTKQFLLKVSMLYSPHHTKVEVFCRPWLLQSAWRCRHRPLVRLYLCDCPRACNRISKQNVCWPPATNWTWHHLC